MSKLFDGTDEPLTYGAALVAMATQISWPTEEHQKEVVRAIQREKDLLPPEPDVVDTGDARDITLRAQDAELEQLRKQLANAQEEKRLREEIAAARAGEAAPVPAASDGQPVSVDGQ
jgi:hypothetical protein